MADTSDLDRFARRLAASGDNLEAGWKGDLSPLLAVQIAREAPRDTGALADSPVVTDYGVEVTAKYAGFVARGTATMAPDPYDLRAIEAVLPDARRLAVEAVREALTGR